MTPLLQRAKYWAAVAATACLLPAACAAEPLDSLISMTSKQVSEFVEQFSSVKCIEQVRQEKFGKDDKVVLKEDSTYDYLVILTNTGGELSLDESRLAVRQAKTDKKNTSMLVSNGFATLFLVFHPYYTGSFQFTALEDEIIDGKRLSKVAFQHVRGTRSVAALALRGKEYPLELSGYAWIDPQTGIIVRITASVENTMEDVGLKTLRAEVRYAPVPFRDSKDIYWFPSQATVEVETPRQHWRNTHNFSEYKKFSVSTEEQVANK